MGQSGLHNQEEMLCRLIQNGISMYGYFIHERRGVFSDFLAQQFGIPSMIEHMPDWMVEHGNVASESVDEWRGLFDSMEKGEKNGSAMLTLKKETGEYGRYWVSFNTLSNGQELPFFAIIFFDDFTDLSQEFRAKDNDINGLLQATKRTFPEILTINLTRQTYHMIQYDSATTLGTPRTGKVEDMIRIRLGGVVPEDQESFAAAFSVENLKKVFLQEKEEFLQLVYRRPGAGGKIYWIETTAMRQENFVNSDVLLVAMSRNVDKQKAEEVRLKEKLHLQAEELRLTLSRMNRPVMYYDISSSTLSLPPVHAEKYGMPHVQTGFPESITAQSSPNFPTETLETIQEFYDTIRSGQPTGSCEYRTINAAGQDVWMRIEYATIFDSENRPVRAVLAAENITIGHIQAVENQQLREKEYLLRMTAQHSDRIICHYDIQEMKVRMWDEKTCERCRLPRMCEMPAESVLGSGDILPESVEGVRDMFRDIRNGKPSGATKIRLKVPGGEHRWFDFKYSTIFDKEGRPVSALISHKDITDQYEHEMAYLRYLQESERDVEKQLLFVECDLTADWIEKLGGQMLPRREWMVKSPYSEFSQKMLNQKFLSENKEDAVAYFSVDRLLDSYAGGEHQLKKEWQVRFHDDTLHWVDGEIMLMSDPYSGHVKAFFRMRDITEEKQARLAMKNRSERDGMTGLLNRATAEEMVCSIVDGKEHPGILLLLDLDDLKGINDTFGHKEGDRAIVGIAKMLKKHFRDSDILGRIGGDEFLVYLPGAAENRDVIAGSITSLLRELSGISVGVDKKRRIHCSIGCAVQTSETDTYEKLFKQADTALYHVKRGGKNNFAFYVPEMEEEDYQFREQKMLSLRNMKRFELTELQHLLNAVAAFYPLVLSVNLSANDYYMLEEGRAEVFSQLPVFGALDHFMEMVIGYIHPEDVCSFHENMSIKVVLKAYEKGQKNLRHCFRFSNKGEYLQTEAMSYLYTNENGDVCAFILIRWI